MRIEDYLHTHSTRKWIQTACPMCGGNDRFVINAATQRWLCRRCSPLGKNGQPRYQDITALVMADRRMTYKEARQWLEGAGHRVDNRPIVPRIVKPPAAPSEEWRAVVTPFIDRAHTAIYRHPSAIQYLESRGIGRSEIAGFKLGYSPTWQHIVGDGVDAWLPKGLVIPRYDNVGRLMSANCRVEWGDDDRQRAIAKAVAKGKSAESVRLQKYMAVAGGMVNAPLGCVDEADCVIVVEGEFDAILLSANAPDECAVITVGASGHAPPSEMIKELKKIPLFLCLDRDEAGQIASLRWREMFPHAKVVSLPAGKDVTGFWQLGGDLRRWVAEEMGY